MGNIRNAVENGLKRGAIGVLNTDWGDRGHWQQLPISYLGFAYGAALSWAYDSNLNLDLPAALDAFAFQDKAGIMGKLTYDLGNAYQQTGVVIHNSSLLFWLYQQPLAELRQARAAWLTEGSLANLMDDEILRFNLEQTLEYIDGVMARLDNTDMARPDAALIKREFAHTARMLKHGAKRGLLQLGDTSYTKQALLAELDAIEKEYRELWLTRNRPGGLKDSVASLSAARGLYA